MLLDPYQVVKTWRCGMLEEQTSVRDQKHNLRTTAKWIYLTWGCKLACGVCAKFSRSIKIGYQWVGVAAQCNVGVLIQEVCSSVAVAHLWVAKHSSYRNHCYCTCWNRSKTVAQRSTRCTKSGYERDERALRCLHSHCFILELFSCFESCGKTSSGCCQGWGSGGRRDRRQLAGTQWQQKLRVRSGSQREPFSKCISYFVRLLMVLNSILLSVYRYPRLAT